MQYFIHTWLGLTCPRHGCLSSCQGCMRRACPWRTWCSRWTHLDAGVSCVLRQLVSFTSSFELNIHFSLFKEFLDGSHFYSTGICNVQERMSIPRLSTIIIENHCQKMSILGLVPFYFFWCQCCGKYSLTLCGDAVPEHFVPLCSTPFPLKMTDYLLQFLQCKIDQKDIRQWIFSRTQCLGC